jgi:hypothetical protein
MAYQVYENGAIHGCLNFESAPCSRFMNVRDRSWSAPGNLMLLAVNMAAAFGEF